MGFNIEFGLMCKMEIASNSLTPDNLCAFEQTQIWFKLT